MLGALANQPDPRIATRDAMEVALGTFDREQVVVVLAHFDADGLSAAALLVRALEQASWQARAETAAKGETPWDAAVAARLAAMKPGGLILCDLGTRPAPVLPGCPMLVIDHHVPTGEPSAGVTISGNGLEPEPTTSLLAWWAAGALGEQDHLLWLAALGLIGDMAEGSAFPELVAAQQRWGKTALRDAVSLINAPRRTASADPGPALRLLLRANGPKEITKGDDVDARSLHAAKAEVRTAMEEAKRAPPRVSGEVALLQLDSACQVHPLVAQQWRGRLKDKIVIAANRGYRPGWVHFAARSATGRNLIDFLAERRPAGADGRYGNGHAQATGGALRIPAWNHFIADLGFPDAQVPA